MLVEYFHNSNPPGIRKILKLQEGYFALPKEKRALYLETHPELKDWWEISKLPVSAFWTISEFREWQNLVSKVDKGFIAYRDGDWMRAESIRIALPKVWGEPGMSDEADWFRMKTYRLAMETWIKVIKRNEFMGIYYFRQLPRWIRDEYFSRHPERLYLSTEPLSRFIEEPLRLELSADPDLAWAIYQHYKYGKNMPWEIEQRVREIFIKKGIWKDRIHWTQEDWQYYWHQRALKLNEVREFDLQNLPLLRKELEKVTKTFPLILKPRPFSSRGHILPRLGTIQPLF